MTPSETAEIVNLLTSTFPAGVRGHIWTRELAGLDHDRARSTYELLAASERTPPSVARFLELYTATGRRTGWTRPAFTGPPTGLGDVIEGLAIRAAHGENVEAELDVWRRYRSAEVAAAIARHPSTRPVELGADRAELDPELEDVEP